MTTAGFGGVLPPAARARLAEIKASGTWGSALSVGEFAAIRSVGFEPVGQVFGAAVYHVGSPGGEECPTYGARGRGESAAGGYGGASSRRAAQIQAFTRISGAGTDAAFGPLVNSLYAARRAAIGRLSAECAELGGHGVVGVRLTIEQFLDDGMEFTAIGTAVRAPSGVRLRTPFTSDISGQEFAKLIMAGFVPVSLVLGISIGVRHDDWLAQGRSRWTVGNVEVDAYTELVNRTRQDARNELMLDISRVEGEGVVIQHMDTRLGEHECPGRQGARDHIAEVTMIGTAITRFARSMGSVRPSMAVLSLDPGRRQAARSRAGDQGALDQRAERNEQERLDVPELIDGAGEEQQ